MIVYGRLWRLLHEVCLDVLEIEPCYYTSECRVTLLHIVVIYDSKSQWDKPMYFAIESLVKKSTALTMDTHDGRNVLQIMMQ